MLTLMTFGAGFLMRPLGAIVLGAYIDHHGRRRGLLITLGLMALGTLTIACTPSYHSIGMAAPLLILADVYFRGFLRVWNWEVCPFICLKSRRKTVKAFTSVGNQAANRLP